MDDNKANKLLKEFGVDLEKLKESYKEKEVAFWNFVKEHKLSTAELGQIGTTACCVAAVEANMSKEALFDILDKSYDAEIKLASGTKDSLKDVLNELLTALDPSAPPKNTN